MCVVKGFVFGGGVEMGIPSDWLRLKLAPKSDCSYESHSIRCLTNDSFSAHLAPCLSGHLGGEYARRFDIRDGRGRRGAE